MNEQERTVIGGIFDRLRTAEAQHRDPEAEAYINDRVRQQPYAPYAMAQTIFVQEQTMEQMQRRIEELEAQQSSQGGGLLGRLFGGGQPQRAPMPERPMHAGRYDQGGGMQPAGPWGRQPQQGGFMAGAMQTAMGVAGGVLIASAIGSMFSDPAVAAPAPEPAPEPAPDDAGAGDAGFDGGGFDGGGDF